MNSHSGNVELNTIKVHRTSLTHEEAILVWRLRQRGDKQHIIAAKLGVNPGRVADVLTGKTHKNACQISTR
ncbi:hypothetical protein D1012_09060 [Pseudotabrizicola alkalilacus]|uniref:Transposase IS30-like HTH domain-containing protein n=1 Tax=Pseudotabrizicola alkalilacus TaxID=2305252 RepID=A0A411Z2S5_9RHOB|nr:hypothetical protein D1012_09060 [Pseudotabrizicola alkalilacus]